MLATVVFCYLCCSSNLATSRIYFATLNGSVFPLSSMSLFSIPGKMTLQEITSGVLVACWTWLEPCNRSKVFPVFRLSFSYSAKWLCRIHNFTPCILISCTGAILEIDERVGVIPATLHLDMLFWPFFSVYTQKESISLFKGLYLLYHLQNFA